MNKFNPKVSIIIPVYNGSNFLKEAIDSALAQTYKNIEIVVVNDGSNDNNATEKIAKSYGDKIKYFKKENGGVATALNLGLEKMTGEYFSWLSHDDMYYPSKIRKQVRYLSHHQEKDIILYSNYDLIDERGKSFESCIFDDNMLSRKPIYSILRGCINGVTILVPTAAFKKHGGFDASLRFTQDYDMWFRMFGDYKFVHMDLILSKTRIHSGRDTVVAPSVVDECNKLWINIIKAIPDSDKELLESNTYNFYVEMIKFLKNTTYNGVLEFCYDQLRNLDKKTLENIKKLKTKVTVITPTYNRADFIKLTMNSILAQDYKDYTYIILDDGSNDDTNNIVKDFIKDKENWFYLYHSNVGEPETVNRGWQLCCSDYFVQVNSDDLVEPNLFSEMVTVLDENPKYVLSYPDFYIINQKGRELSRVANSDFDFIKDLSMFSCYAACPGAFIRKSSFADWKNIRDKKYRYISDVDMLWKMALTGKFIHVPKFLASWRSHIDGVSIDRYKSIEEVNIWIEEYFSQKKLPKMVKEIELDCRRSVYNYYSVLMLQSDLDYKKDLSNYYKEKAKLPMPRYANLQVGDNDLMGNKFNGHNLHINLRRRGIDSSHLVLNKHSNDPNTYLIGGDKSDRNKIRVDILHNQIVYDLDNLNNPLMYDILYNKLFLDSDVVHLHLMHNGALDLSLLPVISKIKPVVWTIHDTWAVLGDGKYSDKPEYKFPSGIKNLPLNFHFKKEAIKNSDIKFVVASNYMKNILENSEMFKDKDIFHIPFGLDLSIFHPRDKHLSRKELGIDASEHVILVRGNIRDTKGLDYVEYVMDRVGLEYNVHLIIVGGNDFIGLSKGIKTTDFGWLNDDELLAKIYSASDILLMPSTREAFGMMAIEAMACGTVPVVIDGTALPETVNAPNCGVSTTRDKKNYCDAVEHLLKNPSETINRATKCVEYAKKTYNIERYLDSIEKVYDIAMSNHITDEYYEKILNEIKEKNITMPRLTVALQKKVHNTSLIKKISVKTKDVTLRSVKSLKVVGLKTTVIKVAKKIHRKVSIHRGL